MTDPLILAAGGCVVFGVFAFLGAIADWAGEPERWECAKRTRPVRDWRTR